MVDRSQPVTPELFGRMVAVAIAAGQKRTPRIQMQGGPPKNPYIEAAIAVRAELEEEPDLFDSVMNRFAALMDLFNRDKLSGWVRVSPRNEKAQDIHPAVVHVAAQFKINKNGKFPEKRFLQAVSDIAARYPAWDELDTGSQVGNGD